MNILVLAPDYPKHPKGISHFGGVFNERCAVALQELCDRVEVLVPRPYAPVFLSSLVPRWKIHTCASAFEIRNGVPVYRPIYLQIPRVGGAFCIDLGAFLCCRRLVRNMHRREKFDAIISFSLTGTGGLAWRIGKDLNIPAIGWATGDDVRFSAYSSYGKSVIRALSRLDVVFYQSHELLEKAGSLLGKTPISISQDRHIVLPRGISEPPLMARTEIRNRVRTTLGIEADQVLVLYIGRVCQDKGIYELVNAVSLASSRNSKIICVIVGSNPAFDETAKVQKELQRIPGLSRIVKLLPACSGDKVWDYLCTADIFAFASHHEGMPNSLLEAMAFGLPTIAFGIPPVLEIEEGTGGIVVVPPLNPTLFGEAILSLSRSPDLRAHIGQKGKLQVSKRFLVRKNMAEALKRITHIVEMRRWPSKERCTA